VRVFKTSWFERFARKNEIEEGLLLEAVERVQKGLIDADLGSGVVKQRIAGVGRGRSKGYRTILLVKKNEHVFFVYGFSKSDKNNIQKNEAESFKKLAIHMFSLNENHLLSLLKKKDLVEVIYGKNL
jgi:hypothetical protein